MRSQYDFLHPFYFYDIDGFGVNPIGRYQIVSLATPAEIATMASAGVLPANVGYGDVCVRTPVSSSVATRQIVGVTDNAGWSLGLPSAEPINVHVDGICLVQYSAALTPDPSQLITAALTETRTEAQTPFTNNYDQWLAHDSRFSLTYVLNEAGVLTITPATTGATQIYYPLGFAIDTPTAKYDILRVDMTRVPRVLYA